MSFMRPIRLALVATVLGVPSVLAPPARAQGSAPNQGVDRPASPPLLAQPPAVNPADVTDGRPRPDTGGAGTSTAPGTTAGVPMPSAANTAPEAPATAPARPGG